MYIFIDESGDLGFDFTKKLTSEFFTITALVCENDRTLKEIGYAFKRTRKNKIKHSRNVFSEFKGTNLPLSTKAYLIKQFPKKGWSIYSIIVRKKDYKHTIKTKEQKERLYNRLAALVVETIPMPEDLDFFKITIDKSKNDSDMKQFNHYIKIYLEGSLPIQTQLSIQHVDSQKDLC